MTTIVISAAVRGSRVRERLIGFRARLPGVAATAHQLEHVQARLARSRREHVRSSVDRSPSSAPSAPPMLATSHVSKHTPSPIAFNRPFVGDCEANRRRHWSFVAGRQSTYCWRQLKTASDGWRDGRLASCASTVHPWRLPAPSVRRWRRHAEELRPVRTLKSLRAHSTPEAHDRRRRTVAATPKPLPHLTGSPVGVRPAAKLSDLRGVGRAQRPRKRVVDVADLGRAVAPREPVRHIPQPHEFGQRRRRPIPRLGIGRRPAQRLECGRPGHPPRTTIAGSRPNPGR